MAKQFAVNSDQIRFVIVGIINTVLDFLLLNLLVGLLFLNPLIANIISTTIAMLFSFFANKRWTFRDAGENYARQVVLFFIFTLIGLYAIQNSLIMLIIAVVPHLGFSDQVFLNIAKLAASVGSLTWNYYTYKHFVFKK